MSNTEQEKVEISLTIPKEYARQLELTADLLGYSVEGVVLAALEGHGHSEYEKAVSLLEHFENKKFQDSLGENESWFEIVWKMLDATVDAYKFFSMQYEKTNYDFEEEEEEEEGIEDERYLQENC